MHCPDKDIVDTAVAAGSFKTLAKAPQASSVGANTVKSPAPFSQNQLGEGGQRGHTDDRIPRWRRER
jgi:hypothetical protein